MYILKRFLDEPSQKRYPFMFEFIELPQDLSSGMSISLENSHILFALSCVRLLNAKQEMYFDVFRRKFVQSCIQSCNQTVIGHSLFSFVLLLLVKTSRMYALHVWFLDWS